MRKVKDQLAQFDADLLQIEAQREKLLKKRSIVSEVWGNVKDLSEAEALDKLKCLLENKDKDFLEACKAICELPELSDENMLSVLHKVYIEPSEGQKVADKVFQSLKDENADLQSILNLKAGSTKQGGRARTKSEVFTLRYDDIVKMLCYKNETEPFNSYTFAEYCDNKTFIHIPDEGEVSDKPEHVKTLGINAVRFNGKAWRNEKVSFICSTDTDVNKDFQQALQQGGKFATVYATNNFLLYMIFKVLLESDFADEVKEIITQLYVEYNMRSESSDTNFCSAFVARGRATKLTTLFSMGKPTYGVSNKIQYLCFDYFKVIKLLRDDVMFITMYILKKVAGRTGIPVRDLMEALEFYGAYDTVAQGEIGSRPVVTIGESLESKLLYKDEVPFKQQEKVLAKSNLKVKVQGLNDTLKKVMSGMLTWRQFLEQGCKAQSIAELHLTVGDNVYTLLSSDCYTGGRIITRDIGCFCLEVLSKELKISYDEVVKRVNAGYLVKETIKPIDYINDCYKVSSVNYDFVVDANTKVNIGCTTTGGMSAVKVTMNALFKMLGIDDLNLHVRLL